MEDPNFKLMERFTVGLYDKTSNGTSVNEARKEMFSKKNRTLENVPPSQVNGVIQHFGFFNEKNNGYENLSSLLSLVTFCILLL